MSQLHHFGTHIEHRRSWSGRHRGRRECGQGRHRIASNGRHASATAPSRRIRWQVSDSAHDGRSAPDGRHASATAPSRRIRWQASDSAPDGRPAPNGRRARGRKPAPDGWEASAPDGRSAPDGGHARGRNPDVDRWEASTPDGRCGEGSEGGWAQRRRATLRRCKSLFVVSSAMNMLGLGLDDESKEVPLNIRKEQIIYSQFPRHPVFQMTRFSSAPW